jgi:hypothetical protein
MEAARPRSRIFVDADACPVKDEVYLVAARYGLTVFVVANSPIMVPRAPEIERVVVEAGPDAADDWIAERAGAGAIVVTSSRRSGEVRETSRRYGTAVRKSVRFHETEWRMLPRPSAHLII